MNTSYVESNNNHMLQVIVNLTAHIEH